jgi:glycosyltransferase involved in cell wall biosynthesis
LAQTYPQWDYTIVDNCSTDGTLAIAHEYAARDSRIRVTSNEACIPAVANFNLAFRHISPTSKYSKMVLADDLIFPECLDRMVSLMEEHPSAGIVGAYGLDGRWVLWSGLPYPSNVVSGREICRQRLLGGPYVFGSPTSVLFRSDLVRSRNAFYDESSEHPDSEVCFELLKDCDFGFIHQVLTLSPERSRSLLSKSRELNTLAPSILHELIVYGPYYLTPDEKAQRLETVITEYYNFLAKGFLQRRNKEFWDYHEGKLKEQGIGFSRFRLAHAVVTLLLNRFVRRARTLRSERSWGL